MLGQFHCASLFYIDKSSVGNALEAGISAVDLFVFAKPEPNLNPSGLANPGITVFIAETKAGKPFLDPSAPFVGAYVAGPQIRPSSDASVPTKFRFPAPVRIKTNTYYALVVKFDQGVQFDLWKNTAGEYLVGTQTVSTGPASAFNGTYFDYINLASVTQSSGDENFDITDQLLPDHFVDLWQPVPSTALKVNIYGARYKINGTDVSDYSFANTIEVHTPSPFGTKVSYTSGDFLIPAKRMEFMTFDQSLSTKELYVGGQRAYQNTFSYPGGFRNGGSFVTVATYSNTTIRANTLNTDGTSFNWNSIFNNTSGEKWIVLRNGTEVDVRQVMAIPDNRTIIVNEPVTFTNAAAQFMITPVALISSFDKSSPFGVSESILTLAESSANSTVRFVNNTIEYIASVAGGSGYSNSDILYVTGFENVAGELVGGYKAVGNISTNTTGGIVAVYMSNSGAGFTIANNIAIVISNSSSNNITSNTSAGSGATFTYTVGATLKTELRETNNFRGIKVINLPLSDVIPFYDISKPNGVDFSTFLTTKYKRTRTANTASGFAYYVTPSAENSTFELDILHRNSLNSNVVYAFVSRSNEFNLLYSNGALNDQVTVYTSNGLSIVVETSANNDYSSVNFNTAPKVIFSKYLVNNDYTNEHTDRGNAWAKGISRTINFGRPADDLVVYLDAYKPANTDIKVYARIYNSSDSEAIDDKDWTLLEAKNSVTSSSSDTSDMVELQFGFSQYPNTSGPIAGSITASNNSSNLVGVGTTFTNISNNSLVRIYPVLFPNTNIIAVVNTVTNNTLMTLTSPITNNSFLGQTLAVEPVLYNHQAFNNIMNENVVRYHNGSMVQYDGYNALKLKIVLLASEPNHIPRVDDCRVVGVSS